MTNDRPETDFNTLIPELRKWNDGKGIDVDSWLACVGNFEQAVAYARLFWPEFTVHDDCVLFAGFNEESFLGFMEQTHGNKKAVEAVMNHRHILDLFFGRGSGAIERADHSPRSCAEGHVVVQATARPSIPERHRELSGRWQRIPLGL